MPIKIVFRSFCSVYNRFTEDIYQMTGIRPGLYWQMTWRYIGPTIMVLILGSSVISMIMNNPKYGAWSAELVRIYLTPVSLLRAPNVIILFFDIYIYLPGCCREYSISELGHVYRLFDDFSWSFTHATGLSIAKIPNIKGRSGHTSRFNTSK